MFGTDLITADWSTAGTKIVSDVQNVKAAAMKVTGYPLKYAFYGKDILSDIIANTQCAAYIAASPSMAQAFADSIPMLVVSAVNARGALGMEAGDLHEVRRQGLIAAQCAAFSHTVMTPDELPAVMARAWAVFEGARPRPVHIEIPRDLFGRVVPVKFGA